MGICSAKEEKKIQAAESEELEASQSAAGTRVVILGARGLREAEVFPGTERTCYCALAVLGGGEEPAEELAKTQQVKNTLEPSWNHEVELSTLGDGGVLEFRVLEADADGKGEVLGKAKLEAARIQEQEGFNGELELEEAGEKVKAFLRVKISLPSKPFPPAPEKEFIVELDNPKKKALGLEVETQDGKMLYVSAVKNGLVQTFNKEAEPTKQIMPGDFIVKVNGVEGASKKLNEALKKKETSFSLVCRRAEEWRVVVDRGADKGPIGFGYVKPAVGHSIVMTDIAAGPLSAWNEENPEREVRPFDRILAINGKRGKPDAILKQMKATGRFTMLVARPAEPEPAEPKPEGAGQ